MKLVDRILVLVRQRRVVLMFKLADAVVLTILVCFMQELSFYVLSLAWDVVSSVFFKIEVQIAGSLGSLGSQLLRHTSQTSPGPKCLVISGQRIQEFDQNVLLRFPIIQLGK